MPGEPRSRVQCGGGKWGGSGRPAGMGASSRPVTQCPGLHAPPRPSRGRAHPVLPVVLGTSVAPACVFPVTRLSHLLPVLRSPQLGHPPLPFETSPCVSCAPLRALPGTFPLPGPHAVHAVLGNYPGFPTQPCFMGHFEGQRTLSHTSKQLRAL